MLPFSHYSKKVYPVLLVEVGNRLTLYAKWSLRPKLACSFFMAFLRTAKCLGCHTHGGNEVLSIRRRRSRFPGSHTEILGCV